MSLPLASASRPQALVSSLPLVLVSLRVLVLHLRVLLEQPVLLATLSVFA